MPHDKPNNTKKYGPAPERDADTAFGSHGIIAIKECGNCDGFHVAVTDSAGITLVCEVTFGSYEEGLAAAKEMIAGAGHVVSVGAIGRTPPELLN